MEPLKIKLVLLGTGKFNFTPEKISGWNSSFFRVIKIDQIHELPPKMDGQEWTYSTHRLSEIVCDDPMADIVIALTEFQLEDNFYCHRLGGEKCVFSWFGLENVLKEEGFEIESFVLRNVYEMVVLFIEGGNSFSWDIPAILHDDTRGCLFDMNGWKPHIVRSMDRPTICRTCSARLSGKQLPLDFLHTLNKELQRLRKPAYARIFSYMKEHPYLSFIWATLWALLLGIATNLTYDLLKSIWQHF